MESYFRYDFRKDAIPWHDFENHLGTFDWDSFYDEYDNTDVESDDFKPSHVYSLEDELKERADELVETIQQRFQEWVEAIEVSSAPKLITFEPGARFITFNYTSTLQEVYGIEDSSIWHIHGRAGTDELVFGHGVQPVEEPEFEKESGESNRTMFSDAQGAAKYPLYAFKKPVKEIIAKNHAHFSALEDISEVVVIGHSLNDVDLPYFREIASHASSCTWAVYCHEDADWVKHPQQLIGCGISGERIVTKSYT